MQGSDNDAELRARLRRTPRRDKKRAQLHHFRNTVHELMLAGELGDSNLARQFSDELETMYAAALKK